MDVTRQRNLVMLLALAAIWGASFMFIKIAVRELSPATLIVGRLGLAALTLALLVPFAVGTRETWRQLRENAVWLVVVEDLGGARVGPSRCSR